MTKIYRYWCRFEEWICGIFLFSIVVLVFGSAFLRYVSHPLIWADDIAKLLFGWTAFLGADVAMRRCRLVGVDIIVNRLSPKLLKITQLVGNLIIACILVTFVYYGFRLSATSWNRYFQTIPVSYTLVTLCLPIGSICMLLTTVVKIVRLFRHMGNDAYSLVEESQRLEEGPEPA